jgi:hypothetical protein
MSQHATCKELEVSPETSVHIVIEFGTRRSIGLGRTALPGPNACRPNIEDSPVAATGVRVGASVGHLCREDLTLL